MGHFFTSDWHLNHENVIKYSKRPFLKENGEPDVALMNRALIENTNAVVGPNDWLYMIGDLALGDQAWAIDLLSQVNGLKVWIFGNHDKSLRKNPRALKLFQWTADIAEIKIPVPKSAQHITLCHYAMKVWNKSHYGAWQLYGHSHNNLKDDPHSLQLDVGVDAWNYKPASFEEIQERMKQKSFRPVDHHGAHNL